MLRKLVLVMSIVCGIIAPGSASAQDDEAARLRVMQLSFVPPSSSAADVHIDGGLVFERITWPFVTGYMELAPGSHTLMVAIPDQQGAEASTSLDLAPGHTYTVLAVGDHTEQVTFVTVDETRGRFDNTGSTATIVNLTDQPILDLTLDGQPVLENIPVNGSGIVSLPDVEFTIGGTLGEQSYSETSTPLANTDLLAVVWALPSGEPQIIYHRSSPLTIAEYLRSVGDDAQFSVVAKIIAGTDLLGSLSDASDYTLFLPVNEVIDNLEAASIPTDAESLGDLLSGHIIAQNLPPYALPGNDRLTTLAGSSVSFAFSDTASGYWEIEGAPILWDVRLANGVIYGIEGVMGQSE
jgi:uncharacterized surface protein with fasciclin (FAS1) repeats